KGQDSPALLAVTKTDLSRLGRIARLDVASLEFYIAALLRDGGLADAARECEAAARALWRNEGAVLHGASTEIFPEDSDWGEALPQLGEYIAAHRGGLPGAVR
ncbi:MAG: ATP-binding protein, partial [Spirochaetaceae bacterium]|nr:ATP-binding protein [Spirochaetaceae bacterium]